LAQEGTTYQRITLPLAVQIALEKNPDRKAALADAKAAAAEVEQSRANLFPHVTFDESATRGNDPVYVFGAELRQQRFTAADLALSALNTPQPFGNFTTRFGGTWSLFDSLASWRGVTRAERSKDAATHQLERADQEIAFHVIDSYYGVLLAAKQLDVADQSLKTARAIAEQSGNRFESGVAVESDALSAQVRLASRQEELVRAQNDLALRRLELTTAMGVSVNTEVEPAEALAERWLPTASLEAAEKQAVEGRPDLKRIASQEAVQRENVAIAKSSFGPRVSAFGGWEADNPTLFARGGGSNWLAGIDVQVDIFQGGAKRAALSHEQALQEKAAAIEESATDAVRLEVRRAYYDLDSARQQVVVARAAIALSQENLRINRNRYEAGLSTISDLLSAEEAARRSQTDYWDAVYRYYTSYASLELATGTLTPDSPAVKP
jgi:outer membrane protein TolC